MNKIQSTSGTVHAGSSKINVKLCLHVIQDNALKVYVRVAVWLCALSTYAFKGTGKAQSVYRPWYELNNLGIMVQSFSSCPCKVWAHLASHSMDKRSSVPQRYSSSCTAEVRSEWSHTSTQPHALMAFTGTWMLHLYKMEVSCQLHTQVDRMLGGPWSQGQHGCFGEEKVFSPCQQQNPDSLDVQPIADSL